jgi:hypothetical protein
VQRGDDQALAEDLDNLAPEMIGCGRPGLLLERADELARLDLRGHPWARLLAACVSWDAAPGTQRPWREARAALRDFRRRDDHRGEAYACYVLGCWTLTQNKLALAGRWFIKSRTLSGTNPPGSAPVLVHLGLSAYAAGRLGQAVTVTEEAVAVARLHGTSRAEATALVNLGFFKLWVGDFSAAFTALNAAEDAFADMPNPYDRYESPLCYGARGVLWALRGDDSQAEDDFARAVSAARQVRDGWYEAIVRALRAEFTSHRDPARARRDSRWALSELERRGETWWRSWAAQAAGLAARAAGLPVAAEAILREVLASPQNPVEKARTQLLLAETLLQFGQGREAEAAALLRSAAEVFEGAGCRYWAVRSYLGLARAGPDAAPWLARARRWGASDVAYRRLFAYGEELRLTAFGIGSVERSGRPVAFHAHNAERALFLLGLAPAGIMHAEQLADALWPGGADPARVPGRIRTLLWDMRRGLGPHAWRLKRQGPQLRLDMTGMAFDVRDLRAAALAALSSGDRSAAADLAGRLRQPLLTRWTYEDWVLTENDANHELAARLDALAASR